MTIQPLGPLPVHQDSDADFAVRFDKLLLRYFDRRGSSLLVSSCRSTLRSFFGLALLRKGEQLFAIFVAISNPTPSNQEFREAIKAAKEIDIGLLVD